MRERPTPPDPGRARLRVAVVRLPRISNFTDLDALGLEPDVEVDFVDDPRAVRSADVVVLPGTRATIADLGWLREHGLADAVRDHAARGGPVLGICGGFQMLGREVADPDGVEGTPGARSPGSACSTRRRRSAPTRCSARRPAPRWAPRSPATRSTTAGSGWAAARSCPAASARAPCSARCGTAAWRVTRSGRPGCGRPPRPPDVEGLRFGAVSFAAAREARIDAIADALEEHLDLDAVLRLVEQGATPGLRPVRGGLVPLTLRPVTGQCPTPGQSCPSAPLQAPEPVHVVRRQRAARECPVTVA